MSCWASARVILAAVSRLSGRPQNRGRIKLSSLRLPGESERKSSHDFFCAQRMVSYLYDTTATIRVVYKQRLTFMIQMRKNHLHSLPKGTPMIRMPILVLLCLCLIDHGW